MIFGSTSSSAGFMNGLAFRAGKFAHFAKFPLNLSAIFFVGTTTDGLTPFSNRMECGAFDLTKPRLFFSSYLV